MVHALLSGAVTRAVCMGTPKVDPGRAALAHLKVAHVHEGRGELGRAEKSRVSDLPIYSGLANPPRGKFRDPKIGVP